MNIYPVDDIFSKILDKKEKGEQLNKFEISNDDYFNQNIEQKAIQYASMIKNLEAEKDAIITAIKTIEDKELSINNKIDKIRYELKQIMDTNNIKKIKTPFFDITVCLNNPGTLIHDESSIPEDYIKETISKRIDKIKLLKDLKEGVLIPGVELEQKTRVEIK
jgi:hypothetical protein